MGLNSAQAAQIGKSLAIMGAAGSIMKSATGGDDEGGISSLMGGMDGGVDSQMATKARMELGNKIQTRQNNMKASRVKMGGKK